MGSDNPAVNTVDFVGLTFWTNAEPIHGSCHEQRGECAIPKPCFRTTVLYLMW